jgi:hypothetical protein
MNDTIDLDQQCGVREQTVAAGDAAIPGVHRHELT